MFSKNFIIGLSVKTSIKWNILNVNRLFSTKKKKNVIFIFKSSHTHAHKLHHFTIHEIFICDNKSIDLTIDQRVKIRH